MDLSLAKSRLDRFYAVKEHCVAGDDPTTTFTSCAVLLLASVLAESRSAQLLSYLTGFPIAFVEASLLVADSVGHFGSFSHGDLIVAVHRHPDDLDRIELLLNMAMGIIWERMDKQWTDALTILRARYLYGGERQAWVHDEEEFGSLYLYAPVI
jgi:hypothetical protein